MLSLIILNQNLMLHIMDLYQRKTLLNQPVNELEGERCRREVFLALFGHLRAILRHSQLCSSISKVSTQKVAVRMHYLG